MAGWLYLHFDPEIGNGADLPGGTEWAISDTVYIDPGLSRMGLNMQENRMTFDRFVRACLPDRGQRLMSPSEQQWVVLEAVQRANMDHPLTALATVLSEPGGGVSMIEQVIGELKRSGVSPVRLKRLWEKHEPKYRELAAIYEKYQELLWEGNLWDHEEPYMELMRSFQREPESVSLPGRLVLRHFYELNRLQELLLGQLVTQVEIHVHLIVPKGRERLGRLVKPLIERLTCRGFRIAGEIGSGSGRVRRDSLRHLAEHVFDDDPPVFPHSDGLEVIAAPGMEAEVEMVVARLKQWLLSEKNHLDDAVILTSDREAYAPLLHQKLDEAGIPVRTEERHFLSSHPLLQMIHAVFSARDDGGKKVEELLYSPFLPVSEENGLKCDAWMEAIPKSQTWAEWGKWFLEWIRPLKRVDRWRELIAEKELSWLAAYEMKGWHALYRMVRQWGDSLEGIFGDRKVTDRQFVQFLMQMAERCELTAREGERRGIRILEANQGLAEPVRAVFMVGLAEGRWPRPFADHWLLPDAERVRLRSEGILLETSGELRQRQRLPFFTGISLATELLVLSYPHTDEEGKKQLPSPFLEECTDLFASVKTVSLDVPQRIRPAGWEWCFSDGQGLAQALIQLRNGERILDEEGHPALEMFMKMLGADQEKGRDLLARIQAERFRRGAVFTRYDGIIPRGIAGAMEKRVWSAGALNHLVECRFQFLAIRLWKAAEKEAPQRGLSWREEGERIHEILCRFFHEYRRGRWTFADEERALARLEQLADEVLRDEERERDPFYLMIDKFRIKQKLLSIWKHEKEWRRKTGFYAAPAHLELSFGLPVCKEDVETGRLDPASRPEPVTLVLGGKRKVRLQGKMDRIDRDEEGYYAIYDYKTGTVPTIEQIGQGRSLQLPLYLWVYQQGFGLDPALAIGSAYYVKGNGGNAAANQRNKGLWRKEETGRVGLNPRKSLDPDDWRKTEENIQRLIDQSLSKAEQGDFAVSPTWDCPRFCPARHICRVDAWILSKKRGTR
ncbi:PD-(D/E)XK nuclease family protein [Thermoactinomyces sp. CICC 10522]|uniref:PD-(D/E)XK nuclease family protein n=1 Tax=Thermoactinomyces sp. CICC 10522 TaxID=2767427 RepID=UPI0018DDFB1D|nr:PD-(D/E)XK nuclease family protein [Thermoactinomyces sp. CICC 10522]MBH8602780.1 PD-(D/E)XK nuclease family protein [Thermoactinomyces sp. CICC 10522]